MSESEEEEEVVVGVGVLWALLRTLGQKKTTRKVVPSKQQVTSVRAHMRASTGIGRGDVSMNMGGMATNGRETHRRDARVQPSLLVHLGLSRCFCGLEHHNSHSTRHVSGCGMRSIGHSLLWKDLPCF